MLYYFFCGKKVRKEYRLNNLTTREKGDARKKESTALGTPSSRVAIFNNLARSLLTRSKGQVIVYLWGWGRIWGKTRGKLADTPFECYFIEVIPPNNF